MPTEYATMEYEDGVLRIDKELSTLDEFVVDVTSILDDLDVRYVVVSGYVSILAGRSRSTEDVDTIIERLTASEIEQLVERLDEAGYWGATTPLEDLHEMLSDDMRVRIAEEGRMTPNFELWFPRNEYDRRALEDPVVADVSGHELNISPPEQQIAYKLFLGTDRDFEDALHLYTVFRGQLDTDALERLVEELEVRDRYAELRGT